MSEDTDCSQKHKPLEEFAKFSGKLLFLQGLSCLQLLSHILLSCGIALQLTVYMSEGGQRKETMPLR